MTKKPTIVNTHGNPTPQEVCKCPEYLSEVGMNYRVRNKDCPLHGREKPGPSNTASCTCYGRIKGQDHNADCPTVKPVEVCKCSMHDVDFEVHDLPCGYCKCPNPPQEVKSTMTTTDRECPSVDTCEEPVHQFTKGKYYHVDFHPPLEESDWENDIKVTLIKLTGQVLNFDKQFNSSQGRAWQRQNQADKTNKAIEIAFLTIRHLLKQAKQVK